MIDFLKLFEELEVADDFDPNAAKTQITGTLPTYRKAHAFLNSLVPEGEFLDFGAGKGVGSSELGMSSYEPFAQDWEPTYRDFAALTKANKQYSKIVCMHVFNVVRPAIRDRLCRQIAHVLAPGGAALIITRTPSDVATAKAAQPVDDESGAVLTSKGTYQKGFTPRELMDYLEAQFGEGYSISRGPREILTTSVLIQKDEVV